MAKIDKTTEGLLASLEERSGQIRELERETENQAQEIKRLTTTVGNMHKTLDEYRNLYDGAMGERKRLADQLAQIDAKGVEVQIERRLNKAREMMSGKNYEIRRLSEQLHRCLGWISARLDKHPTENMTPPVRALTDSYLNQRIAGTDDEEIPF